VKRTACFLAVFVSALLVVSVPTTGPLGAHGAEGDDLSATTVSHGYVLDAGAVRWGRVVRFAPSTPNSVRSSTRLAVNQANAVGGFGLRIGTDATAAPAKDEIVIKVVSAPTCGLIGCAKTFKTYVGAVTAVVHAEVQIASRVVGTADETATVFHELGHALGLGHFHGMYGGQFQIMNGDHSFGLVSDWRPGDKNGLRALAAGSKNGNVRGAVDVAAVEDGHLRVAGWVIDFDSPRQALPYEIFVNGSRVHTGIASSPRPDVANVFPEAGTEHGFDKKAAVPPDGTHQICLKATGHRVQDVWVTCRSFIVHRSPIGYVDTAQQVGPANIQLTGWVFDPDLTTPVDVHVYVDGRWGGMTKTSLPRPAVHRSYPVAGPNSGYSTNIPVLPGVRNVCAYAINVSHGVNSPLGCRSVAVWGGNPLGNFESATTIRSSLVVSGWAFDPDTTTPIDIHMYVNGGWGGVLKADKERIDVGRFFVGYGNNHGVYDTQRTLPKGKHQVCLYAINKLAGTTNPLLGCRDVTVP
jgi:hypothetical protein